MQTCGCFIDCRARTTSFASGGLASFDCSPPVTIDSVFLRVVRGVGPFSHFRTVSEPNTGLHEDDTRGPPTRGQRTTRGWHGCARWLVPRVRGLPAVAVCQCGWRRVLGLILLCDWPPRAHSRTLERPSHQRQAPGQTRSHSAGQLAPAECASVRPSVAARLQVPTPPAAQLHPRTRIPSPVVGRLLAWLPLRLGAGVVLSSPCPAVCSFVRAVRCRCRPCRRPRLSRPKTSRTTKFTNRAPREAESDTPAGRRRTPPDRQPRAGTRTSEASTTTGGRRFHRRLRGSETASRRRPGQPARTRRRIDARMGTFLRACLSPRIRRVVAVGPCLQRLPVGCRSSFALGRAGSAEGDLHAWLRSTASTNRGGRDDHAAVGRGDDNRARAICMRRRFELPFSFFAGPAKQRQVLPGAAAVRAAATPQDVPADTRCGVRAACASAARRV